MAGRITVIGSANVDFVMRLPHLPRRGESVNGGPFIQSFGGKGSNQALAARRAGAEVSGVFSLGDDAFADRLLAIYAEEGIDVAKTVRNPGQSCGVGMILVDAGGDNLIATALCANALLDAGRVEAAEELIAASAVVMLQMETSDDANRKAVELAARHGAEVFLNYAPACPSELALGPEIGVLAVNETEAALLSGLAAETVADAERAAKKLAEKGHRVVIVTLGEKGCVVHSGGETAHHPAFAVAGVDATAAGDSFCGALAAAFAEGRALDDAVRFASAAGALCASRAGAMPSIPRREEIERFLAENGDGRPNR